jgi:hypothetical protein
MQTVNIIWVWGTCEHTYEVLHGHFIPPVVHLHVAAIHVEVVGLIVEHLHSTGEGKGSRG